MLISKEIQLTGIFENEVAYNHSKRWELFLFILIDYTRTTSIKVKTCFIVSYNIIQVKISRL